MCVMCHGTEDLWEGDTKHLYVPAEQLANDVHWKKGIHCQDCHGGNPEATELREAHAIEDGFRKIEKPAGRAAVLWPLPLQPAIICKRPGQRRR